MEFELKFISTHTIKSLALADFVTEWTLVALEEDEISASSTREDRVQWTLHFDGSFTLDGAGTGALLTSLAGEELCYVTQLMFHDTSNNMAEYEGLRAGLLATISLEIRHHVVRGKSQLVIQQVKKVPMSGTDGGLSERI